jgi:twinkle protein
LIFQYQGIYEKAEELVLKLGINGLLMDPWNKLRHRQTDTDYIRDALNHITYKSKLLQIHSIIVAHPTKMRKVKVKGKEKYEVPTLYSISGSADFYNMLDNGLTVYRDTDSGIVDVYRQKIRYNWLGEIGWSSYRFDWDTQQYIPVDEAVATAEEHERHNTAAMMIEMIYHFQKHYAITRTSISFWYKEQKR